MGKEALYSLEYLSHSTIDLEKRSRGVRLNDIILTAVHPIANALLPGSREAHTCTERTRCMTVTVFAIREYHR